MATLEQDNARQGFGRARWLEALVLLGAFLLVLWVLFGPGSVIAQTHKTVAPLLMPLFFWATFRFGRWGAVAATALVHPLAILGTFHRLGPWVSAAGEPQVTTAAVALSTATFATCALIVAIERIRENERQVASLNERLAQQVHRLQEVDRLKNSFVSAVSHELRTPLTSIVGFAEFLEDEVGGAMTPENAAYVGQIQVSARRLLRLVDDLLDFALLDSGTFKLDRQESSVAVLVGEAVAGSQGLALAKGVRLRFEAPEPTALASVDPDRIGQVVLNLTSNAVKFAPVGSEVRVTVRQAGTFVRVEVADAGPGIAEADQERLFERFTQLEAGSRLGGVGLGLSICKGIVEEHGGRIGVDSKPGAGSTFWFTLPALGPAR